MIARRDLIIGGACVAAAAAGAALKPRRETPLLKGAKIADIVPATFEGWTSEDVGDPLAINGPGTLSAKIYNELLVRAYVHPSVPAPIVVLLAYGGRQSDDLQLHRPEICYPAFGFNLVRNEALMLPIPGGASLPVRRIAAENEDHRETVVYWTRIGETLPQDGSQQRKDRLKISLQGIIPDGLLSRFSMAGDYPETDWKTIEGFVSQLLLAIRPDMRKVLIGTERADLMKNATLKPPA